MSEGSRHGVIPPDDKSDSAISIKKLGNYGRTWIFINVGVNCMFYTTRVLQKCDSSSMNKVQFLVFFSK